MDNPLESVSESVGSITKDKKALAIIGIGAVMIVVYVFLSKKSGGGGGLNVTAPSSSLIAEEMRAQLEASRSETRGEIANLRDVFGELQKSTELSIAAQSKAISDSQAQFAAQLNAAQEANARNLSDLGKSFTDVFTRSEAENQRRFASLGGALGDVTRQFQQSQESFAASVRD